MVIAVYAIDVAGLAGQFATASYPAMHVLFANPTTY